MGEAKNREERNKELFEKEPEKFVHVDELVFAIRISPTGHLQKMINMNAVNYFDAGLGAMMNELPFAKQIALKHKHQGEKRVIVPRQGDNGKVRF